MSADICSFGTLITSYDLCLLSKCDKEIHCNLYHKIFCKIYKALECFISCDVDYNW